MDNTTLKNRCQSAVDSLNTLQHTIIKTENMLVQLRDGDKNRTVYKAFRAVAFFVCECVDDVNVVAATFGDEWKAATPKKAGAYHHAIYYIFATAGFVVPEYTKRDNISRWVKVIKDIHPRITSGIITETNFIDAVCRRKGGIRGYYDTLTGRGVPKKPGTIQRADDDSGGGGNDGGSGGQAPRKLIAIILDISKSNKHYDINNVKTRLKDWGAVKVIKEISESTFSSMGV
jgi:hypothetical protein